MNEEFVKSILEGLSLPEPDLKKYSPLTLAYVGDCVYEMVIRMMVVYHGNASVNRLHGKCCRLVNAKAQSDVARIIADELTEEEMTIYKRGRNAYSPTRAKNATMTDYRRATGLEALVGQLYMEKKYDRLVQLIKMGLDGLEEEEAYE